MVWTGPALVPGCPARVVADAQRLTERRGWLFLYDLVARMRADMTLAKRVVLPSLSGAADRLEHGREKESLLHKLAT